jgi:alpha-beta hydrolase superfamily lysophospholipase
MGSFAVQQFVLDNSDTIDAMVLSGTTVLDLLEPALNLEEPIDLAMFNAPFAPARTEFDWLTRDEAIVDAYVADPWCGMGLDLGAGQAMFAGARRLADPAALGAIRSALPVLIVVGDADPVNGQMQLVHALVQRLTEAGLGDVTLQSYPDGRHEILNETNRDEVTRRLVEWVQDRATAVMTDHS